MLPTACRRSGRLFGHRNLLSFISSFSRGEITVAQRGTVRFEYSPGELRRLRNLSKRILIDQIVFKRLRD